MHARNHWGGSFEINNNGEAPAAENTDWDRASLHSQQQYRHLDETQQSWLLEPPQTKKKNKYVDFGCFVCSRKAFKWTLISILLAFLVIAIPIIITKLLPKQRHRPLPPDNYTLALHKALLFFNAQKSGKLPKNNGISWRGNSGLDDGKEELDLEGGLVGGYYDAGDTIKFHFPMAFSMTMLSWSLIEYNHKYQSIGEYDHIRDLIKWGIFGPDLAGEMAAALAAASIVFRDNVDYSRKLIKGAQTVFAFARDGGKRRTYSRGNPYIEPYYNSTGYYDEYMWGAAWLYYATGNVSYISLATNPGLSKNSKALYDIPTSRALSWDNKLPAAMLLLTRYRIFLNPGYPYEDMLQMYHNVTALTMCSYLKEFRYFNWTRGGMIQLNLGKPQPLQYVANAAFLANLFADYLNATGVPGWNCGSKFFRSEFLRNFATSQVDYILGKNPMNMSYVVGYGKKFPRHVHHRGASIPHNNIKYSCTSGWKWRDTRNFNPNNITGAMVGGPDRFDNFRDVRTNFNYTEPTMAGNAGLIAALASLTRSGGQGIDKNTIFSAVPPLYPKSPPPPAPWKP
ncbi:hypothetical protein CRYUN_Cryun05aG0076700 [Craigia yunnanensis]